MLKLLLLFVILGGGINPLALLIAPLVGISLLTAAVAVALNPGNFNYKKLFSMKKS